MVDSSRRGMHVALLGIDGIGKSTLASQLADELTRVGRPVVLTSWRRYIDDPSNTRFPAPSLRNLYFEAFRLFLGGGTVDGGARAFPPSYEEFAAGGGGAGLGDSSVEGIRPTGPLAAVHLELAGNLLFYREVVRPLVESGHVVIEESYGYKHVVKDLLYASKTGSDRAELDALEQYAAGMFGRHLRPDVPVFVDGDPALALRWRTVQHGTTGRFEGLPNGAAGTSFLAMQSASAPRFEAFATRFGWPRVTITDQSPQTNLARLQSQLSGDERGRELTEALGR